MVRTKKLEVERNEILTNIYTYRYIYLSNFCSIHSKYIIFGSDFCCVTVARIRVIHMP